MKKIILITACLLSIVLPVSAQQKGNVIFGVDFGIGVNNTSVSANGYGSLGSASSLDFTIAPKFGFFVANNLRLDIGLGYGVQSTSDDATHALTLGPMLSYYVSLCENLYFTPAIELAYCYASSAGEGYSGFGVGATLLGLEYKVSEKIGISGSLLSLNYILFPKGGVYLHNLDLSLSINPKVGIRAYF